MKMIQGITDGCRRLFVMGLCLILLCVSVLPETAYAEETSENMSPFILPVEQMTEIPEGFIPIHTAEDLNMLCTNPTGKFILMNDIALNNSDPLGMVGFQGELRGNGYRLTGLYVTGYASYRDTYGFGLFSWIKDAVIQDLYVQGEIFMTDTGHIDAEANVGAIAGAVSGKSKILLRCRLWLPL